MGRVTLITGYYYPEDTAIGLYNNQLVYYLEEKGYEVKVITSFPWYPQWKIHADYKNKPLFIQERLNKTTVYRYKQYVPSNPTFFKRILLLLDFTFGSFINLFKIKKCDAVICVVPHTSTMLLGWILKSRKKAKLWNHIQDFEFDAAKQTGLTSSSNSLKNVIFDLLFKTESFLLNRADLNSSISSSMLNKLDKKSKKDTYFFPNWIDSKGIDPKKSETHEYLKSNKFKILYSGNIGDKQDWDFFLSFAKRIESLNVAITLVGDGAKGEWLRDKVSKLSNVSCYKPVKYSELSSLLCSADLHILFQKNDVIDSVMPSKILGMMASGKPSMISGNKGSEVRKVVEESNGGYYIIDNEVEDCFKIVQDLIANPENSSKIGLCAREYVINNFSKNKVLSAFENRLQSLLKTP